MPKKVKQTAPIAETLPENYEQGIPNNTLLFFNEEIIYDIKEPVKVSDNYLNHRYAKEILKWRRDEYGFLKSIEYKFREDNRIDWRAMLPSKYLVPNKEKFEEGTDLKTLKIEELKDNQLLVLLGGFRYLLNIRGYLSLEQNILFATPDFASATCKITLLPNYETNGHPLVFVGEGDSNQFNTHSWARNFPTCIAANRAFVRAARNALNIEVIGADEVGPNVKEQEAEKSKSVNSSITDPISTLKNLLTKENVSFDSFKQVMIKAKFIDDSFTDINQFPREHVFEAIGIVKIKVAERKVGKK